MKQDNPRLWIHAQECDCAECTPYHPAVPPALTWVDLARYATLGLIGGTGGAMALDPPRTAVALAALLGWG